MTTSDAQPRPAKVRDRSVDVLRGIGIVVVAMGHVDLSGVGGAWAVYLYSFNVALFFVVSGYMWRDAPGTPYWRLVVKKARQILLPYAVLFAISLLYGHIIVRYAFGQAVAPFDLRQTAKAFLLSSEWLNTVPTFNFALWFLPIFFVASALFPLIQKIKQMVVYVPVVVLVMASAIPIQYWLPGRPPLAINVLPVAIGFMGAGFLVRRWLDVRRVGLPVATALFALTLVIAYNFPGNVAAIGTLWYFPSAVASFILYLRIAQDVESSRLLAYIGANSLVIFGVHGLVANTYGYTPIPSYFADWNGLITYVINVVYVVIVSVAIVFAYRWVKARALSRRRTAAPRPTVSGTR